MSAEAPKLMYPNGALVTVQTREFASASFEEQIEFLRGCQIDLIEVHPFRANVFARSGRNIARCTFDTQYIGSTHQTFNSTRNLRDYATHLLDAVKSGKTTSEKAYAALFFFATRALFQTDIHSLRTMRQIQLACNTANTENPPIPAIVYHHNPERESPNTWLKRLERSRLQNLHIQPCPELFEAWGIHTLEDYLRITEMLKIQTCTDTYHTDRKGTPTRWQETIDATAAGSKVIHASFRDEQGPRADGTNPIDDLRKLLSNNAHEARETPTAQMLLRAQRAGFKGNITIEAHPDTLISMSPYSGREGLRDSLERTVAAIQQLIA